MSNVIHLITNAGEPLADSREIASGLGLRSKSVNVLIDRYAHQFRRFGVLAFEMAKPRKASGSAFSSKTLIHTPELSLALI